MNSASWERRVVLRVVGLGLWMGFAMVLGLALLAWLTPGEVDGAGVMRLRVYWFAFMGRTYVFHMGLAAGVIAAAAALARRIRLAGCAVGLAAALAGPGLWAQAPRGQPVHASGPVFRVMSCNLLVGHSHVEEVLAAVAKHDPDVILFQEYSPRTAEGLVRGLRERYPYRAEAMRDHAFGEAVFSKLAFVGEPEHFPHEPIREGARQGGVVGIQDPQIRVVVDWRGTEVVVQDVHTVPPMGGSYLAEQRKFIGWLAGWAKGETRPVVIAGDFNSTPESHNAADLRAAGLVEAHAAAGRGRGGTWPTDGPLAWFPPVRIDMIWASAGLRCVNSEVCERNASDHRPVVAEFVRER